MTSIEEKVGRPAKHLTTVAQSYPGIWKRVDQLRANRDKVARQHYWPTWCYLPVAGAAGIIADSVLDDGDRNIEASCVATLAGWRLAKDIYVFDETIFEELWNTPIEGNLPIDVLYKLPTFCAYVAFPSPREVEDGTLHGFFVHLNYSRMPMLLIAMDYGHLNGISAEHVPLVVLPVELHEGVSLLQSLTIRHERIQRRIGVPPEMEGYVLPEAIKHTLDPLLSLTLYLCSTSAVIRARDPLRGLRAAYTKKTKKGVRTFVPDQPQVWEVTYRRGATLRADAAAAASPGDGDGGTHASPRPHIRKAHWHSYWTGPKAAVGKAPVPAREVVLRWIPPTPVAMGPGDEAIPTVHRVTR